MLEMIPECGMMRDDTYSSAVFCWGAARPYVLHICHRSSSVFLGPFLTALLVVVVVEVVGTRSQAVELAVAAAQERATNSTRMHDNGGNLVVQTQWHGGRLPKMGNRLSLSA